MFPLSIFVNAYLPSKSVETALFVFFIKMFTPGSGAPELSETIPDTVEFCEKVKLTSSNATINPSLFNTKLLFFMV